MFRRIIKYCSKHFGLFEKLAYVTDRRIKPQILTIKILAAIVFIHIASLGSLHSFSQSKASKSKLPSVSTIARVADTVSLDDIRDVSAHVYKIAREKKMIEPYLGQYVAIIDGHELTVSDYCKCSHCKKRKRKIKNGIKYEYYHSFTALILAGGKYSFVLDIEPILPGESEVISSYRLLERVCKNYPKAFKVVIGDALYLNGKIFKLLESHHKKAIAVLKEERRQLFEEANKLSLLTEPKIYTEGKTTYRIWDHTISSCWDGYGKNVRVIVSEETTTKRVHAKDGKGWEQKTEVSNWMWVTNLLDSSLGDLKNTVRICHSRWQIENKCFNETAGTWKADHIYRHSANAITAFLLLLFICVNIFNIFLVRNIKDVKVKTKIYLIDIIKAEFLTLKRLPPPVLVPI